MNTLRISILAALLAAYQPGVAQIRNRGEGLVGNGQIVHQTRTLESFNQLRVDFAMKVRITEGDPTKAELEGEQNVLPYVTVSVSKGELTVGLSRETYFKDTKPVMLTIHRASLQSIQANTACIIISELPIQTERLTVHLDEASKLTTSLAVGQLRVDLASASSVDLKRKAQSAVYHLDGASRVAATNLIVAKAELTVTGASHAAIHVTDSLSASADGVSTIRYSGNPTVRSQSATGLSSIKRTE